MEIEKEVCFIYGAMMFLLFLLFIEGYNKHCVKYIVMSSNERNVLKVHTKPIPFSDAVDIYCRLKEQYNFQNCNNEAFIVKFTRVN